MQFLLNKSKIIAACIFCACSIFFVTNLCACVTNQSSDDIKIRVASLKGPTSIGLACLMSGDMKDSSSNNYNFDIFTQAEEITAKVVSGDVDIALIPANLASILHNKSKGEIKVININTLGVLYVVGTDDTVQNFSDLCGKTVYSTGAGTTPQYISEYLADKCGIADQINIEYKSQAEEIVSFLNQDKDSIAILPEPYVTTLLNNNSNFKRLISLQDEWDKLDNGSICTGVAIVRSEFLKDHKILVDNFLKDCDLSTKACMADLNASAQIVAEKQIIPSAQIAKAAIPNCNITCIVGKDLQNTLEPYLKILHDKNANSIGGKMPNEDFYYLSK